jgi:hypothetical protein
MQAEEDGNSGSLELPMERLWTVLDLRGLRKDGQLLSHKIVEGRRSEKSGIEMKFAERSKSRH